MKKCTYWMHGFGGDDAKATAKTLKETGFDIVVAGGEKTIEAVRAEGMASWVCGGAFGLGDLKDDDSVRARDLDGKPQTWFGSGCPNNSTLRDRNLKSYEEMAATQGVSGILVDGCRFASPASGRDAFFTCFCGACREKAGRLGIDFERMKGDVAALREAVRGAGAPGGVAWLGSPVGAAEWLVRRPGVLDWLRFRRLCVSEHFRAVSDAIHGGGKRMGVYIFTPSLAPFVGQCYADLKEFVDVFAPMIYRNYAGRPGIACLNWELGIPIEEVAKERPEAEAAAAELVLRLTGLAEVVPERSVKEILAGQPPEAVGREVAVARSLLGKDKELAPILYIDDPEMARTARLTREAGADGINFFAFQDKWRELVAPAFPG